MIEIGPNLMNAIMVVAGAAALAVLYWGISRQ